MRFLGIFLPALLIIQPCSLKAETGCLRVASVAEESDLNIGAGLGEALYREAGLCATFTKVPSERARRMLDSGELDAVVARTKEFIQGQQGMLAVPTPLLVVDGRLYWRAGQAKPQGPSAKVGFPRGWVWSRLEAQALGAEPVEVSGNGLLVKMTESGRLDGFILPDPLFDALVTSEAERAAFASVSIRSMPLYHAVTKNHADLVPALDAAIQRLVARGDIARLLGQHPDL